jgi:hypothetical protein
LEVRLRVLDTDNVATQLQGELRTFIRTLPNAKLGLDEMSEEAYFCGRVNFAHFHGPRHIDIRLSAEDQKRALDEGQAHPHLWSPRAGWVSCTFDDRKSVNDAKELVRKAYCYWDEKNAGRRQPTVKDF